MYYSQTVSSVGERLSLLCVTQRVQVCRLMGGGKTTVVGPLLAWCNWWRVACCSGPTTSNVETVYVKGYRDCTQGCLPFSFDRFCDITRFPAKAAAQRAVVCSHPTAVKAFALKVVELLHIIDQMQYSHRR